MERGLAVAVMILTPGPLAGRSADRHQAGTRDADGCASASSDRRTANAKVCLDEGGRRAKVAQREARSRSRHHGPTFPVSGLFHERTPSVTRTRALGKKPRNLSPTWPIRRVEAGQS
jgi:hypothetical protein